MTVALRKLERTDDYLLVSWRNQDRDCFLDSSKITLESHRAWYYYRYILDPADQMYMVVLDGKPVGTIGVRLNKGSYEIQRVLLGEKTHAHSGVMSQALHLIFELYGPGGYFLEVLRDNLKAQQFYLKHEFKAVPTNDPKLQRMGRTI
jgi:acetyltransferase (GNAT) family protein